MDAPISSPHRSNSSSSMASTASSQSFVPPRPQPMKEAGTESFLQNLNLVAEAAKRAQMACLMRDMESCGLS